MTANLKLFRIVLVGLFAMFAIAIQAQTVSGNVKDATGEGIIGATVLEKGTTNGTVTDLDGNFSIKVAQGKTLVFSYIGMKTKEVKVTGDAPINVTLEDENTTLNEVVVVGYGTVKKKDLMGSVATVGSDKLAAVPVANAAEALQGKMAGVQITTTEGSPDADVNIRVRGGGSITQSNEPLYIVDGFPVESISDIPSSDIEDITVLKDASSTAIYGSRGANGVILVTTKSGKEGKLSVSYNFYYSAKKMAKKLNVLGSGDYARWQYEAAQLANHPEYYTKFFGDYADVDLYDNVPTNDWQDQVYGRWGHTMNHALNINGGSDVTKYAFSYARMDDKAIMQKSDFTRDNLSLKLNHKVGKKVSLDFQTRWSKTTINGGGANEQSSAYNTDKRLRYAVQFVPFPVAGITGLSDDDSDPSGNFYHPVTSIYDNDMQKRRMQLNLSGAFTWEIFKNFKFKSEVGYDTYAQDQDKFMGTTTYYVHNVPQGDEQGNPAVTFINYDRRKFRNTNTVSFNFKNVFKKGSRHALDALLGEEYMLERSRQITSTVHNFPVEWNAQQCWTHSTQGSAYESNNFVYPNDVLFSFFGRANYNYDSRYYFTTTMRADGSSKFAKGNRWGFFPSASVAWRISSEKFMESTQNWLEDLKLRFSYGTAGNNNIPSGMLSQLYESSTTSWINGTNNYWGPSKTMANPDLKWETTVTRNLGLDYSLFRGRLAGSIEAYWNSTKDLLIQYPVAGTGYDYQYRNMGETRNTGFEVSATGVIVDKKNFGLTIGANVSINRNKVISLGDLNSIDNIATNWASTEIDQDFIIEVGQPIGQIFGYKAGGRYEVSDFDVEASQKAGKWVLNADVPDAGTVINTNVRPGSMKIVDLNGDGKIDTKDRTIIGDTNPDLIGGFNLNARFYGFDLAANFNFSIGNDVYNANAAEFTQTGKYRYRNLIDKMQAGTRWTNVNSAGEFLNWNNAEELAALNANTTNFSPYTGKYVLTSDYVENASFLRLNTLTLGYTIPKTIMAKAGISNLRVYFTCYNVFTVTNYSGTDPEVNSIRRTNLTPGVDYSAYPKSRQFVFGLNLNL